MKMSHLAEAIHTSPILTLAAEINGKIQRGEKFYNLTVGDFNPQIFPIPEELREAIIAAYQAGHTNYPGAVGVANLRQAIVEFLQNRGGVTYSPDEVLIASGGRPLIYAAYQVIVDPGDKVIFPVPSWNNDYYCQLSRGEPVVLETTPETNFMPTAESIEPHLNEAVLIALCSPLNPTGTVLREQQLRDICDLVLEENRRRGGDRKPVYLLFDQIYWLLTFGSTRHYNAVNVCPEIRDYAIFTDGISKAFAATGVRLGWGFGPAELIGKMKTVVAHMGAWAPKAEQVATGEFLSRTEAVENYLNRFRREIQARLEGFYKGFMNLRQKGYPVDAIEPQAAIYLTVKLDLVGARTAEGQTLSTNAEVHRYILNEARVGLVPFSYFGASPESPWYRLSVGTCRLEEVEVIMSSLEAALERLQVCTRQ